MPPMAWSIRASVRRWSPGPTTSTSSCSCSAPRPRCSTRSRRPTGGRSGGTTAPSGSPRTASSTWARLPRPGAADLVAETLAVVLRDRRPDQPRRRRTRGVVGGRRLADPGHRDRGPRSRSDGRPARRGDGDLDHPGSSVAHGSRLGPPPDRPENQRTGRRPRAHGDRSGEDRGRKANVASTAALVLGSDAEAWLTERGVHARLVLADGSVRRIGELGRPRRRG